MEAFNDWRRAGELEQDGRRRYELEAGETVVAMNEEERLYREAKHRYDRAEKWLDEAEESL